MITADDPFERVRPRIPALVEPVSAYGAQLAAMAQAAVAGLQVAARIAERVRGQAENRERPPLDLARLWHVGLAAGGGRV